MSHDPPAALVFEDREPSRSTFIEAKNRVPTFSVCCPAAADDGDCGTCCVGAVAPCCLVGAVVAMRRDGFQTRVDPCDGCGGCGGPCCGTCLTATFLPGWLGPLGSLIHGCVAMECMSAYDDAEAEGRCARWMCLSFCFPCEACATYRSALNQVTANGGKEM